MRYSWLVGFFLGCLGTAWALTAEATREQVIAELGKPTSVAKMGQREILLYPKGVRLELENGQIVAAKGIDLSDRVVVSVQPTVVEKAKAKLVQTLQEKEKSEGRKIVLKPDESPAGLALVENPVEQMEKKHEQDQQPKAPKPYDVIGFFIGLVLKFLLTVAALKLSCKYWGAEIFWDTILIVCGVDAAVCGGMTLVAELLLGFPTLFSADDLVGGIVMLFLLKKLSVNHSIGQAIQLTLTTKIFSVVVGSFLVTVLLRLLH